MQCARTDVLGVHDVYIYYTRICKRNSSVNCGMRLCANRLVRMPNHACSAAAELRQLPRAVNDMQRTIRSFDWQRLAVRSCVFARNTCCHLSLADSSGGGGGRVTRQIADQSPVKSLAALESCVVNDVSRQETEFEARSAVERHWKKQRADRVVKEQIPLRYVITFP